MKNHLLSQFKTVGSHVFHSDIQGGKMTSAIEKIKTLQLKNNFICRGLQQHILKYSTNERKIPQTKEQRDHN